MDLGVWMLTSSRINDMIVRYVKMFFEHIFQPFDWGGRTKSILIGWLQTYLQGTSVRVVSPQPPSTLHCKVLQSTKLKVQLNIPRYRLPTWKRWYQSDIRLFCFRLSTEPNPNLREGVWKATVLSCALSWHFMMAMMGRLKFSSSSFFLFLGTEWKNQWQERN